MRHFVPLFRRSPIHRLRRVALCWWLLLIGLWACMTDRSRAAEPSAAEIKFFEQKIQPVLVAHCYECHSAQAATQKKLKGGLRVDSRKALRAGGESGPAVVPGKIKDSLLISAIRHEDWQMPPKGKLSDAVIADFVKWVEMGAPDPRSDDPLPESSEPLKAKPAAGNHWAFQPLNRAAPLHVPHDDWSQNAIDGFVLAKLDQQGLQPSAEADRFTLIRRLTLDLTGLPPKLEEVDEFLADELPGAYERLVERLLASPHYGERWGRHWLDLARYADSSGFHNDLDRPTAWRYRDYVIRSFNEDQTYARFVAEQLAGDEVDSSNEDALVATGFCRNGPSNDDNMGNDKEKYRLDQLDDVISTTASTFLGLTLGCARCHDHKYDPLPTEDYYRFLAIFNNTEKLAGPKQDKDKPQKDVTPLALIETSAKARPTFVLRRGNNKTPGAQVAPGVPAVLTTAALLFPQPQPAAKSTGQRRALADWITSPDNALAYRVLANRLWQHHFGRGIVETSSNFGLNGAVPTHPELLDYLADQIIQHGGQLKAVHRLIVSSATYRQASGHNANGQQVDPQNLLLWRMNPRRLEAETLRDSVLAAAGNLNTQMSGPGIKPRMRADLITASQRNKWPVIETERPEHWRRSVYIYVKRQLLMPMMELFDAPTTTESCSDRMESVVPTQALILMNDEFIEDQAGFIARRVERETSGEQSAVIDRAFRLTVARSPSSARREQAINFLQQREQTYRSDKATAKDARQRSLRDLCHVLLNSSEFVFVE